MKASLAKLIFLVRAIGFTASFCGLLLCSCACAFAQSPLVATSDVLAAPTRILRPAIRFDLTRPLIDPEPNREPIAQAAQTPGIYRAFLVWRQKYAHLAICTMDLCHGSCIEYGDGCLVCAQKPILPAVMAALRASDKVSSSAHGGAYGGACATGCAPSYVIQTIDRGSSSPSCATGGCH